MFPHRKPRWVRLAIDSAIGTTLAASAGASLNAHAADAAAVRASDLPPISAPDFSRLSVDRLPVYLATKLNTRDQGMAPAQMRAGTVWMLRATLVGMGVKNSGLSAPPINTDGEWLEISTIPGIMVDFNASLQSLVLTLPFDALNWQPTDVQTNERRSPRASSSPGILVNYDLYGWANSQTRSLSASTEFRAFRETSVISSTMLTRYQDSNVSMNAGASASSFSNVRLDTTFSRSFQDELLTLRLGDTLTGSLPWSRATRIGGIQLARNFALQPFQTTAPIPALMGTSALPSDVALYINGIKQYQGQLPAGPFVLNSIPGLSGSGGAQVVLTDALGRATTLNFSLYQANQLLRQGLSDWSAEFGWVRKNYGLSSFDYGSDPLASGTWRYGLIDQLTLQSHAEVSSKLVNAGGGAAWQIGNLGVVSAAAASSHFESQSGHLARLDYNWNNQAFNIGLSGTRASEQYRDAASLYDSGRLARSGSAFFGYNSPDFGNLNVGWLYLRNFGTTAQRYATLGWSRAIGQRSFVNVNLNHNLDDSKRSNVQFLLSWYLDGNLNLGTSITHTNNSTRIAATANQRPPSEGGWGWSAMAQSGDGGQGQVQADYVGRKFEATAAVSHSGGTTSGALGASGALVLMNGHAFASRRIYDSFAVVNTNGVPDVPIKRDNLVIGSTDANGVMLVPQLLAYQNTKISIDPMSLPAQMRVPDINQSAVPTDRSGVLVNFDLKPVHSATVVLHASDRKPLPIGSIVTVANAQVSAVGAAMDDSANRQTSMVGYDGATFLDALPPRSRLTVYLPDGSSCKAALDWPGAQPNEVPIIGPIICRKQGE
ncbi:fimbrial biogenesis outer membrane usher protein [Diaphorobacter sp. HDW4A]|uniref:fimbria/pilus outer membrane usher protein n=1 Tax=Diaphorobacter sp. HDW4A TaxID=2714924 RepID=UPI00140AD93D|nr:fimbria/pilus outer membrane usher protein [Diaphorobacter sp. HDW4A]QIL81966.1 fimbrial biogenesis outer membrane usher protein [Diaphorobacter sp. HDW4A]